MLHRTVEVSKLQWLGAEMSLRKAMKELQENSTKLAQLFRRGLIVTLTSFIYQLQFTTYFTGQATQKAFVRLYYFPCI